MRKTTAFVAGLAALSLVAAGTASENAVGTAATTMTALEIEITGLGDVPALTVLDLGTYASNDLDAARNAAGGGAPFAFVGLVPLDVAGETVGAVDARSDASGAATSSPHNFADPLGVLTAMVGAGNLTATASATEALATAEALTARVDVVGSLLGLDINSVGVGSMVTQTDATASQGLQVGALDLDLADLLPREVLEALPLDILMELLGHIPVGVPDLQAIVDAALAALAAVEGAVNEIVEVGAATADAIDDLNEALADLADAEALVADIEDDLATLAGLDLIGDPVGSLATLIAIVDLYDCGIDATLLNLASALDDTLACVGDALADAEAVVESLEGVVTAAEAAVTELVGILVGLVEDLAGLLDDLLAALLDLSGSLDDVIDALLGGNIVDIGAIQVGVLAHATDTVAGSSATVGCNEIPVSVLGLDTQTASCGAPLTAASSFVATATDALKTVLGILPIVGDLVPDVTLEVFGDVTESVTRSGDYTVAAAGVTALRFELPSVTLDPSAILDGLLAELADELLATLLAALPDSNDLDALGLGDLADLIDDLDLVSIEDLEAAIADLLALLELPALPALSTPGLRLVVDPVSTAEFAPAAPPAPAPPALPEDTTPAPDPEDDEDVTPSLPSTGGGLVLLALLALAGAYGLRRGRA